MTVLASMKVSASNEVIYSPWLYATSGDEVVAYVEEHAENINKDVLAAYEKNKAKYKVLALTTSASDSSNARTVIVTLIG